MHVAAVFFALVCVMFSFPGLWEVENNKRRSCIPLPHPPPQPPRPQRTQACDLSLSLLCLLLWPGGLPKAARRSRQSPRLSRCITTGQKTGGHCQPRLPVPHKPRIHCQAGADRWRRRRGADGLMDNGFWTFRDTRLNQKPVSKHERSKVVDTHKYDLWECVAFINVLTKTEGSACPWFTSSTETTSFLPCLGKDQAE